jgi:hypothetical protein
MYNMQEDMRRLPRKKTKKPIKNCYLNTSFTKKNTRSLKGKIDGCNRKEKCFRIGRETQNWKTGRIKTGLQRRNFPLYWGG